MKLSLQLAFLSVVLMLYASSTVGEWHFGPIHSSHDNVFETVKAKSEKLENNLEHAREKYIDPIGDAKNPGEAIEALGKAGVGAATFPYREGVRETARLSAPVLAEWIQQSKNDAIGSGVYPIPEEIRTKLALYFDNNLLDSVKYRVGRDKIMSLQNLSMHFLDMDAITLEDVIVFFDEAKASDDTLWAHELGHAIQYRNWGTRRFAEKYILSSGDVENDADNYRLNYISAMKSMQVQNSYPQTSTYDNQPIQPITPDLNIPLYCCNPVNGIKACQVQANVNGNEVGRPCQCMGMYGIGLTCGNL